MDLLTPFLPRPSLADRRAGLVELLSAMAATGLTGAHVMDLGDGSVPDLLAAVEDHADLPVRLRLAPGACRASTRRGWRSSCGSRRGPGGCGGSAG